MGRNYHIRDTLAEDISYQGHMGRRYITSRTHGPKIYHARETLAMIYNVQNTWTEDGSVQERAKDQGHAVRPEMRDWDCQGHAVRPEMRDWDCQGHAVRPEIRDWDCQGHAVRPEIRDWDCQGHAVRPEIRDMMSGTRCQA